MWRREHVHICILSTGGNKLQCFFLHTLHDVHTTAHTVTHTTGWVLSLFFSSLPFSSLLFSPVDECGDLPAVRRVVVLGVGKVLHLHTVQIVEHSDVAVMVPNDELALAVWCI